MALIDQITSQKYSSALYLLSQQKGSKLAPFVRNENVASSELAYFDTIAQDDDTTQKTARHSGTPISEPNFNRRKVTPYPWTNNKGVDKEDLSRMLSDPLSAISQNQAYSLGRKKDDLIIAAALGTAATGKTGTGSMTLAAESIGMDSNGTVTTLGTAPAYNTASTDITLAKMLTMMRLYNDQDVDMDLAKNWAVSPSNIAAMLDITELTSSDYATVKALSQGKLESFMGFRFIMTNRLLSLNSTNDHWRTFSWAEDGLVLATIGDISTRVDERIDLDHMWQILSKMDLGAVRMEGCKVHECLTSK